MTADLHFGGAVVNTANPMPVVDASGSAASTVLGATTDAIVAAGAVGTLSAKLRRVTQGLEDLKTLIVLGAGSALIGKVGLDQTTPGTTNAVYSAPSPQTPASYRSAIAAADVMAAAGTVTCTKLTGVGALTAATYYVKVVAINAYGRTTATNGNTTVTTETTNLGVRAAFAQVAGATAYDVYCSAAADPLFTGRITETQRASGIVIDTHNHTAAGGTAGAVDIYPVGTGLTAGVTAATNTAYVIPANPVNCAGFTYCDFDLSCSRTGDDVAPALTVAPFLYNSRTATYQMGQAVILAFGGTSGALGAMKQRIRVDVRGNSAVALVAQLMAGTGFAVNVDATLS